jgi:hypothetical protein
MPPAITWRSVWPKCRELSLRRVVAGSSRCRPRSCRADPPAGCRRVPVHPVPCRTLYLGPSPWRRTSLISSVATSRLGRVIVDIKAPFSVSQPSFLPIDAGRRFHQRDDRDCRQAAPLECHVDPSLRLPRDKCRPGPAGWLLEPTDHPVPRGANGSHSRPRPARRTAARRAFSLASAVTQRDVCRSM